MTTRAWQHTFAVTPGTGLDAALDLEGEQLEGRVGEREIAGLEVRRIDDRTVALRTDAGWVRAFIFRKADEVYVTLGGETLQLREAEEMGGAALGDHEEAFATSPMTGVVVKIAAGPGDTIAEEAELLVVEAMKMEYVVRAPRDVVIEEVQTAVGDSVEFGQVLITFQEAE
ncbi:MAG: hypothetical protein QNJ98_15600 [Planctomycetota bacterium]|nr:hypothetical protein [Planctomycetota bacterium]